MLLAALTALFIGVGAAIGGAALWLFAAFSVFMNVAAYWLSDKFAIRSARAVEVSPQEQPDLHRLIEELAQLYGLPKPRVFMIPSEQPNAFATGRNAEHAAVAVTQGLLQYMPRDQVRGVLAHEFAHVKNRDILVCVGRGDDRRRDLRRSGASSSVRGDRRRQSRQPARRGRRAGDDHRRADRGVSAPARGLAPA